MKVFVQSVNFNADKKLIDFVEKKVMGLEKFHDKIIDIEVFLKVQNTSEKENKHTELKINIPGSELIVKKETKPLKKELLLVVDRHEKTVEKIKRKRKGITALKKHKNK